MNLYKKKDAGIFLILGAVLGSCIAAGTSVLIRYFLLNEIPHISQVQSGYIPPNELEIECEDLDRNGELETIIRISGQPYLLKYGDPLNVNNTPVLRPYKIKIGTDEPVK